MLRTPLRTMATSARKSLTIGLIPADGIGKEVIPVSRNHWCYNAFSSLMPRELGC